MTNLQHVSKSAAFAKKAVSFLAVRQPVAASGAQLTTNVRVMASGEPFPTIAGMVEDLVCKFATRDCWSLQATFSS